jgi:hypothetical protein
MQEILNTIQEWVLTGIVSLIAILLTASARWALQWLRAFLKKYNIEIEALEDDKLRLDIRNAARGVEEYVARRFKVTPNADIVDKAEMAFDWVQERYPNMKKNDFVRMLDEELAYMEGMGSTGGAVGVLPEDKKEAGSGSTPGLILPLAVEPGVDSGASEEVPAAAEETPADEDAPPA